MRTEGVNMRDNKNNSGRTIFSNGNPVLEISSKWGESSEDGFLTHSKEGSNDGSGSLQNLIKTQQESKNKEK